MVQRPEAARRRVLPPTYFLGALLVMAALHLLLPGSRWLAGTARAVGIVPILVGVGIALVANRQFAARGTTVRPFERSSVLVMDGLFGISRNPMYLGMLLVLGGVALLLGTLTPLLVPPLFAWLITFRFIRHEERALEVQFGRTYQAYRDRVRRWL